MTDAVVLTIKTAHDGPICALTLSGALDFTTAAGFLEHVAQAVDDRTEIGKRNENAGIADDVVIQKIPRAGVEIVHIEKPAAKRNAQPGRPSQTPPDIKPTLSCGNRT